MASGSDVFALPDRLAAKRDPALIAQDRAHFERISASLAKTVAELETRLDLLRRAPGGSGQDALERDLAIHESSARLRTLARYGLDLCLGKMVDAAGGAATYIGRIGLVDADGERLLVDWRSPAAEPFFGATLAAPMGLASRRRYRWSFGRITDYWDEAFADDVFASDAALDDQSAFIASLGASRSSRMRDVLGTIQADQDAIIRAGARGVLVVDGGPGTGKTVVALHRAAYLLYADPRLSRGSGGVLFVGPTHGYLGFIGDVLPGLGEEGVQLCTLADLVPEGQDAVDDTDAAVVELKSSAALVDAVEAAVAYYERPPTESLLVDTPWTQVEIAPDDWADAFRSAERGASHNEARDQVWDELVEIIAAAHDEEVPEAQLRRVLAQHEALRRTFTRSWPVLDPAGVIADLWSVPAYLRRCAPELTEAEVAALQRSDPRRWTSADLPLLDAARQRIGDPEAPARTARRAAQLASEREVRSRVIDDLIAADDSDLKLMSALRGEDFQNSLDDEAGIPTPDPDRLAGPFAHIVVDEAQELTDAQWQMLRRRCPSGSFTVVGDRAQARHGFERSWEQRLGDVGLASVAVSSLRVNYRTPTEVMDAAAPVIREVLPDANVPTSVRSSGIPVRRVTLSGIADEVHRWLGENDEGTVAIIGVEPTPGLGPDRRLRQLTPEAAKGLEFDLVVLIENSIGDRSIEAAVDRYVAMTRSTRELVLAGE